MILTVKGCIVIYNVIYIALVDFVPKLFDMLLQATYICSMNSAGSFISKSSLNIKHQTFVTSYMATSNMEVVVGKMIGKDR